MASVPIRLHEVNEQYVALHSFHYLTYVFLYSVAMPGMQPET